MSRSQRDRDVKLLSIMIDIHDLFETHITVSDLDRATSFYRDVLQLPLALHLPERGVTFFWIGGRGKAMLGLWQGGSGPLKMNLHFAFRVSLEAVLESVEELRKAGVTPLDFDGHPATEPVVLGWMPAAAVYFKDPDGNMLEFLSMLDGPPRPEIGVTPYSEWLRS
jgi:lactoylglutathione lyase